MDERQAHRDVSQGAAAAFFVAVVFSAGFLLHLLASSRGGSVAVGDPFNLLDVIVGLVLGFGLLRYSRLAAVLLFVYFSIAAVRIGFVSVVPFGVGFALALLFFLGKGLRGSFAYHRLRRRADPGHRPESKRALYLGLPAGLLLLLIAGLNLASALYLIPSGKVVAGETLYSWDRDWLRQAGVLQPGETLELYYSSSRSVDLDGSLLTDRRVVSYREAEGALRIEAAAFEEIESVEVVEKGGLLDDKAIAVRTRDGKVFRVLLSNLDEKSEIFLKRLKERLPSD